MSTQLPETQRQCDEMQQHPWQSQKQMGECQVHGCILCRLSDTHPIPMFWSYHQYSVQRGQHLPGDNWWYPQCTCMDFTKMSAKLWRKKWMYCKHLHYVFICLCKVDFKNNEFIHASTSKYNKVMCLLELASVVQGFILVSIFVILWQSKISHYCGWNLLRFIRL